MQSMANGCFQLPTTSGKLKEKGGTKKEWDTTNDAKPKGIVRYQVAFERLHFLHAKHTGAWLIVWGIIVHGTVLMAT